MVSVRDEIARRAEAAKGDVLDLCARLIRIRSENPPGDSRAVRDFVGSWLESRSLAYETIAAHPTMPNLVCTVDGKRPGKHLVMIGHMDTYPLTHGDEWVKRPFAGEISGGNIYGCGVADSKAALAALMVAYAAVAPQMDDLAGKFTLVIASDVVNLGPYGTPYVMASAPWVMGDALICGEPTSLDIMVAGEKGTLWIEVITRGKSAHGAMTHLGASAIDDMMSLVADLKRLEQVEVEIPPEVCRIQEGAAAVIDREWGGSSDALLRKVTVNVGVVQGGDRCNMIAERCSAEVDIRAPHGMSLSDVEGRVDEIVAAHLGASYSVLLRSEPHCSDPAGPIFELLRKNGEAVTGVAPVAAISNWTSSARLWRMSGRQAVVYGPRSHNVGSANEHVSVSDLQELMKIYAFTAHDFVCND